MTPTRRYHTSRVVCEVLDPGGYPALSEPTELRHVLQKTLPEAPPPDYPSGKRGNFCAGNKDMQVEGCLAFAKRQIGSFAEMKCRHIGACFRDLKATIHGKQTAKH